MAAKSVYFTVSFLCHNFTKIYLNFKKYTDIIDINMWSIVLFSNQSPQNTDFVYYNTNPNRFNCLRCSNPDVTK